jgi:branched-chain amino acid transport system substrate-binding protein
MKTVHKKVNNFFLLILLSIIPFSVALSQSISEDEINKQFDSAVTLFNSGDYNRALIDFNKVITDHNYNSKTTASEFFKTKIYLELKQFKDFKDVADGFLDKYPNSKFVNEIRLLLTKYNLEIANYYNAFRETLYIIEKTSSPAYELQAKKIGDGIAAKYLNDVQLQRLNSSFTANKVKSFVFLQIGKYLVRTGDSFGAKSVFSEIMKNYPESTEYNESKKLYNFSYDTKPAGTVIGVMLPFETNSVGEFTSQPSSEILEGIKFAVNEFNKLRSDKIGLLIRDTKKDVEEVKKIREEFTSLNSLVAVLGPIFSNEVRAALEEFDDYNIPIISPTATDDGLTSLSRNFFQANPSFSSRGRVMAQYIFYVENKRTVSVLNSIEGYSPLLAANFTEEFERLGGKVLRRESFNNSTTNFSEPISRIYSDSLIIEGVYIPLSDNSVTPYILSELTKYNMKIPLFGNQDWFTAKGFETAPEISNNLVFTSDYFIDFGSDEFQNFNSQFISLSRKDVNRNVLYGYDAAKFLLTAIRNSEPGRENLRAKMISGMTTNGLHNNISFDEKRVNKFLNIVRYKDGVFELVDKFRLSQE